MTIWFYIMSHCHNCCKVTIMIFRLDRRTLTEEFVSDLFFIASGGKFKYVLNRRAGLKDICKCDKSAAQGCKCWLWSIRDVKLLFVCQVSKYQILTSRSGYRDWFVHHKVFATGVNISLWRGVFCLVVVAQSAWPFCH